MVLRPEVTGGSSPGALGRVCKLPFNRQRDYREVKRMMRLRPKVKELLPKIAEVLISIEIDSLERQ